MNKKEYFERRDRAVDEVYLQDTLYEIAGDPLDGKPPRDCPDTRQDVAFDEMKTDILPLLLEVDTILYNMLQVEGKRTRSKALRGRDCCAIIWDIESMIARLRTVRNRMCRLEDFLTT